MIAGLKTSTEYFQEYPDYFWQWAERRNVIEWKNGATICFTEDLVSIMKAMTGSGLPPFGSVLLLLSACNDNWKSSTECIGVLHGLKQALQQTEPDADKDLLEYYVNQAIKCLDLIAALPNSLRKGMQRAHLLHEVCKEAKHILKEDELRGAADDLLSGRLLLEKNTGTKITRHYFVQDLECLVAIFHKYPSAEMLERQLKTGLFQLPAPAPVEVPQEPTGDVLQDLAADEKTAGLAELARRLIAALNIPLHSQGSSDQLFGGVSDITNRGQYDRLLISELAYDDNVLFARLANNEALYLRREQLPSQPKNKRYILVDATIKMWGIPRVFAMSAAIACTLNKKHNEDVETLMLGGDYAEQADTKNAQGVRNALAVLDASLDCIKALQNFFLKQETSHTTDTFFISRGDVVHSAAFQKLMGEYPASVNFIVGVDRNGEMIFYEVIKGRLKKLSAAKLDIEDILNNRKRSKKQTDVSTDLPAFFSQETAPLFFPTTALHYPEFNSFYKREIGVLAVSENMRLLYWPNRNKGAVELLNNIEVGAYAFGYDGENVYLLVTRSNSSNVVLYKCQLAFRSHTRIEVGTSQKLSAEAVYNDLHFYIRTFNQNNVLIIDCLTGKLDGSKPYALCSHIFESSRKLNQIIVGDVKKYVNNGYNVLHRVKSVGTSLFGNLSFDGKVFTIPDAGSQHLTIKIFQHKYACKADKLEQQHYLSEKISLTTFKWPNGSRAVIDSRGLLHLVSVNASLPQVTLVLIQGRSTAAWSSTGEVTGSDYFLPEEGAANIISPMDFHIRYIAPIIKSIS